MLISKYNSLSEWRKTDPKAVNIAKKHGLIDEICEMFGWEPLKKIIKKPNGYWNPETIFEESKKYKKASDWKNNSSTSYSMSFNFEGLYDKCLNEMGVSRPKPIGYWNIKENVLAEALKYKTPVDWKSNSSTSYSVSFKKGWYDECIAHMGVTRPKPSGYWQVKENVLNDALNYKTRSEWNDNSGSGYNSARQNGWLDECTAHMDSLVTPADFWTKEKVIAIAKKYEYYHDWVKNDKKSVDAAKKNNWLDECTKQMKFKFVKNGYWQVKENVLNDALNYKTRSEWSNKSAGAYNSAKQNGWYEECSAHMEYAEGHTPAGFWTKEKVIAIAKKYNNRVDWVKNDKKSVNAARTYGWLDECLENMALLKKAPNYWNNKKRCIEDALKYNSRSEWQKKNSSAYKAAIKNEWCDECCHHMIRKTKPIGYWTLQRCKEEALKYNNEKEWRLASSASLQAARKNKWYDECTKHMFLKTKKNYWTLQRCKEDALNYKTRSEWSNKSAGAYSSAKQNGWYEECSAHMEYMVRPNGTWTKELLINEARKWENSKDWRELGEGISRARALGYYNECISHMVCKTKPIGYWNIKENVLAEALKYKNKVEWQKKSNGSMKSARKNGWLDECSSHMKNRKKKIKKID